MTKVAVALSGGIDSAVVAALLLEQGYDVVGVTGKMTCSEDSEVVINNAKKVADKLGIQHFICDVSKIFHDKVIKYFVNSYQKGETPNPCVMCNKHIKWGVLFDFAINELGVDYIATGHYAKIKKEGAFLKLYPACDEQKDQLYFLSTLSQEHLFKTLFPLGDYKKSEVKMLAEKYDLPPKSAKESQDICFIKPPLTTKKYLNNVFSIQKGSFVEKTTGKVLGSHDGYWQYTVGQRKGIGIAAPYPLYVLEICADENIVYVGSKEELIINTLTLDYVAWAYPIDTTSFEAMVKIRYNMKPVRANITISNIVQIEFLETVSALAPGQACVIYDKYDGHLLAAGFI